MTMSARAVVAKPAVVGGAFDPLTLTPAAWFDFSDAASVTLNSGKVSAVNDKSGNAKHLSQPTTGNQANYATTGLNGLGAWDTGTGGLNNVKRLPWAAAFVQAQPFVVYIAFKNVAVPGNNMLDNPTSRVLINSNGSGASIYAGTGLATAATQDTSPHVFVGVFNGGSSILRVDGTQVASGAAGANGFNASIGDSLLGGDGVSSAMNILIGEVLIDDGTTVSTAYETALRTKWGTA